MYLCFLNSGLKKKEEEEEENREGRKIEFTFPGSRRDRGVRVIVRRRGENQGKK